MRAITALAVFAVLHLSESVVRLNHTMLFDEFDIEGVELRPIEVCKNGCYAWAAIHPTAEAEYEDSIHVIRQKGNDVTTREIIFTLGTLAETYVNKETMQRSWSSLFGCVDDEMYYILNSNPKKESLPLAMYFISSYMGGSTVNPPPVYDVHSAFDWPISNKGNGFMILSATPFTLTSLEVADPSPVRMFAAGMEAAEFGFAKCEPLFDQPDFLHDIIEIPVRGPLLSVHWHKEQTFSFSTVHSVKLTYGLADRRPTVVTSPGFVGCSVHAIETFTVDPTLLPKDQVILHLSTSQRLNLTLTSFAMNIEDKVVFTSDESGKIEVAGYILPGSESSSNLAGSSFALSWKDTHPTTVPQWAIRIEGIAIAPLPSSAAPPSSTPVAPVPSNLPSVPSSSSPPQTGPSSTPLAPELTTKSSYAVSVFFAMTVLLAAMTM